MKFSFRYHDDVVLGHVGGQLEHVAPVGGLLGGDDDVGGEDLQCTHVRGKRRTGRVRTQQKDSLDARMKAGYVEITERADWLIKYAIDQVDGSFLSIKAMLSEYRTSDSEHPSSCILYPK